MIVGPVLVSLFVGLSVLLAALTQFEHCLEGLWAWHHFLLFFLEIDRECCCDWCVRLRLKVSFRQRKLKEISLVRQQQIFFALKMSECWEVVAWNHILHSPWKQRRCHRLCWRRSTPAILVANLLLKLIIVNDWWLFAVKIIGPLAYFLD